VVTVAGIALPFAVGGILLAIRMNRRMSQRRFEIILSIVIGLMGVLLWMR
jgi:4-amino-4-deoxy-L-arabinose transferase-like glycosyltransferase